ncbi:MAG: TRAP transporter small permease subunit [Enhydrobacter sp.]|nr:MAG: TRAP transporter small permease subunit [Enhydrobacter sp.]
MVIVAFVVVILRYVFAIGWVWLQESFVWMHGLLFMLGAGYTLLHNQHVRVDIFYRGASVRNKAWIDLFGAICLLAPMLGVVFFYSTGFVERSWSRFEGSAEAGGLPGLFILKTAIPVFCLLLALQGVAIILRCVLVFSGREEFAFGRGSESAA